MGQKSTRIDDSNEPNQIVSTRETLIYTYETNENKNLNFDKNRIEIISDPNNFKKNNQIKFLNNNLLNDTLTTTNNNNNNNKSYVLSSYRNSNNKKNTSRSSSAPRPATDVSPTKNPPKTSFAITSNKQFINNFYVFINGGVTNKNQSISYYIPSEKIDLNTKDSKNELKSCRKRCKSNTETIDHEDNQISLINILIVEEFSDFEQKTIQLTYKFIKDDLNNVGVIAFMKSFETLPDMINKFESFKSKPIDELSKSHALRTHSKKVMNVIDKFVHSLEDNRLEEMKDRLFDLGERHYIYRVKKDYFLIIEYQFINAITPIINKNLQIIQKNQLVDVNEEFSAIFDDHYQASTEEDLYIDAYLNNEEIKRALELIQLTWHKVFEIIRYQMSKGIDSFGNKTKV